MLDNENKYTPGSIEWYKYLYVNAMINDAVVSKYHLHLSLNKIIKNKERYQTVQAFTKVPWQLIGAIHCLESGFQFDKCLHNGESIYSTTKNVPKGRGPFNTWEEAAIDLFNYNEWVDIKAWPLEKILMEAEWHNGMGYLRYHPDVKSPYLWSGTTLYHTGKYAHDGKWDQSLQSQQLGVATALKMLEGLGEYLPDYST